MIISEESINTTDTATSEGHTFQRITIIAKHTQLSKIMLAEWLQSSNL